MKWTDTSSRPAGFWGKLNQETGEWHSVVDHCADVAACTQALLERTLLGTRLARLAGQEHLTKIQVLRLTALAAMHDIGKFNHGFQNKALKRARTAGHVREVVWVFDSAFFGEATAQAIFKALDLKSMHWTRELQDIAELMQASICHHGKPQLSSEGRFRDERLWLPENNYDPIEGIASLTNAIRQWVPAAFGTSSGTSSDCDVLPTEPSFVHAFSGLVMLADWLGSDPAQFPYTGEHDLVARFSSSQARARQALRDIGADVVLARDSFGPNAPDFAKIVGATWEPRPAQAAVGHLAVPKEGSVCILESETGSGKTEAALWHFLRLFHAGEVDGLYFALPTRTAATQLYERVVKVVERVFPERSSRPPVVLAVPGYLSVDGQQGKRLAKFEVLWPDERQNRGWAAEHPKRYLAGAIAIGTIDQVLLSSIKASHAHMRGTALLRSLLIVDEVHASDAYMNHILGQVLSTHLQSGGHAFLMSATLGSAARSALLGASLGRPPKRQLPLSEAIETAYPRVELSSVEQHTPCVVPEIGLSQEAQKTVEFVLKPPLSPEDVADLATSAAAEGAKVIVLHNTVGACIATQRALEDRLPAACLFRCGTHAAPHHSRYATPDRRMLDHAVERVIGKDTRAKAGIVVVATQTIQQSLDLDADLLITDLCPMDVLLQRVGRLHRHARKGERPPAFESARCFVMSPGADELETYIRKDGEARGKNGWGSVYRDLRILALTDEVLRARSTYDIPKDNRLLVESATHPSCIKAFQESRGDAWRASEINLHGSRIAEIGVAESALLKRSDLYSECATNWDSDTRAKTRLGEGDRRVEFESPVTTPFGNRIKHIDLAAWLFHRASDAADDSPVKAIATEQGFEFTACGLLFSYSRLGVQLRDS